jgi:MYXO-CTERM domain-containing protein
MMLLCVRCSTVTPSSFNCYENRPAGGAHDRDARKLAGQQMPDAHPSDRVVNRADNALVQITDMNGVIHEMRVNQRVDGSGTGLGVAWTSLGNYAFDGIANVELIVDDQAGGYVVADGARFTFIDNLPDPGTGGGAIPEPMTAGLALLALGALGLRRRRV